MKTRFLLLFSFLTICKSLVLADVDVSDLYLQNAGFDDESHFDYTVSDNGNVAQEISGKDSLSWANASNSGVAQMSTIHRYTLTANHADLIDS